MLTVLTPGAFTTVQDAGRYGYQRFGVPVCGAMDMQALALANLLAGNEPGEAALELTGAGCAVRFESPNIFALSGADFSPRLSGKSIETGRAVLAQKGDILELGFAKGGFRGILAVAGGFDIEPVMGSRSTCLKGGFGGLEGRALRAGDRLPFREPQLWLPNLPERTASRGEPPGLPLRIVLGPQLERFSERGVRTFLAGEYTVTPKSDRMGCRLEGPAIEYAPGCDGNIISDGIVRGSVQVPSGQPIVMMSDCQTTGGYAKIGVVLSCDLWRLGQAPAGHKVRFCAVTQAQGERAAADCARALRALRDELDRPPLW